MGRLKAEVIPICIIDRLNYCKKRPSPYVLNKPATRNPTVWWDAQVAGKH